MEKDDGLSKHSHGAYGIVSDLELELVFIFGNVVRRLTCNIANDREPFWFRWKIVAVVSQLPPELNT